MLGRVKLLDRAIRSAPDTTCLRHRMNWVSYVQSYATESPASERTTLVVGGGRGMGLEYVKQLLERPQNRVIAACRKPSNADGLNQLRHENEDRLELVQMDITDEQSIQEAFKEVSGNHKHLHRLINAAGILHSQELSPETTLSKVEAKSLLTNYQINAMGPILTSKAFAPLLVSASKDGQVTKKSPAVIASMSARVGSIGDNNDVGGWHSYRASKTALNQLNKCMSIEFARKKANIACILLHPGTVDTDLSKPFQKNVKPEKLFTKERAVKQLLEIIEGVSLEDNGRFIAWDGQNVPW